MAGTCQIIIAGCERQLPVCPVNKHLDIVGFVVFDGVEITECAAGELLARCPEHGVIITAETKGIPLRYEVVCRGYRHYVVARRNARVYIRNCIHVEVKPITTDRVQDLYLSEGNYKDLAGKRILIVDDMISTGESSAAIEKLVHEFGGNVVDHTYALVEGNATKRDDIILLEPFPPLLR